jgi:hypothetical protein
LFVIFDDRFPFYLLSQNTNSAKTAPPTLFIKQTTFSEIVQFVIKLKKGENQKYLSVVKADNNDNIMKSTKLQGLKI